MSAPAEGQSRQARKLGPAYVPRVRTGASRARRRLMAALGRQWLPGLCVAAVVAGGGLAVTQATPAPSLDGGIFWSGLGACLGAALGCLRELTRRTITSASALSNHRNFPLLGAAPELNAANLRELAPEHRTPAGCLAFLPASPFATAFRDLQGTLSGDHLVAFACSPGDDSAGLAAMGAAASATQQGRRVILVDCDPQRRDCTRALRIEPDQGATEATLQPDKWRDFVVEEPETGLSVLPATRASRHWRSLFDAPGWPALLGHLREAYDLVALACPAAANARVAAAITDQKPDQTIVVASWDRTPISDLHRTCRALRGNARRPVGVFVAGVPDGYRFGRLRPS